MLTQQQRLKADSMMDIIISLHADGVNVFHTHSQMLVGLANVGILPPKKRAIKPSGDVKDRRTLAKRAKEWDVSSGNDVAGQMAKMLKKDPNLFQKVVNSKLLSVSLDKHFGAVAAGETHAGQKSLCTAGSGRVCDHEPITSKVSSSIQNDASCATTEPSSDPHARTPTPACRCPCT